MEKKNSQPSNGSCKEEGNETIILRPMKCFKEGLKFPFISSKNTVKPNSNSFSLGLTLKENRQ